MTAPPRKLGMTWITPKDTESGVLSDLGSVGTNTRNALWPERWPAIALQVCIDQVEAAPPDEQSEVKYNLPCMDCAFNTACLNAKSKELGPLMYGRELLTLPRSSESSLFPLAAFQRMLQTEESLVRNWRKPFSLEHEYRVVQAWDIAFSEKIGGDYLVCMTASIHLPTGVRQMLDIERWTRVSFDDQVGMIEQKWRWWEADVVIIETDAAQAVWAQHVERNTAVPVVRHTGATKQDLALGVPKLLIELSNRKWRFPYAPGSYHREETDNFLMEAEAFGWNNDKLEGVGEHDDTVMTWWHLSYGMDLMLGGSTEQSRGVQPGVQP